MTDVFISYSGRAGAEIADEFRKELAKIAVQSGVPESEMQVFVAHRSIHAGANWEKEIWENLPRCKWFFYVVTEGSNKSHYAQQELGAAIALKKTIFPLLGKGVSAKDLPGFIKGWQAVDIAGARDKIAEMIGDIIGQKKAEIRDIQDKKQKDQTGNILLALAGVAALAGVFFKK
ncbi:MAG: toll/interleukin-1 receptor domain-containing protein [Gammaproteobacteria bacterium]